MPLSEHERRQLEQIEAALRAGDPRFAGAVRAADPRVHYRRRVIAAALGFVAGAGLLLAGVAVNVIVIAVAGFVVMLACSLWAITSYRRMTGRSTGRAAAAARGPGKNRRAARGRPAGKQAGPGLMGRLEERWRRRQQGGRWSLAGPPSLSTPVHGGSPARCCGSSAFPADGTADAPLAGGLIKYPAVRGADLVISTGIHPGLACGMLSGVDVDADRAASKVWENRIRRMAGRQGLRLEKSRRRDTRAAGYGTYRLVDPATGTVVSYGEPAPYGLTLDDIEKALLG